MTQPVEYCFPPVPEGAVPYWRIALRGCSQLCFQTNELTALFFIAGVLVASPLAAAYLVVAALVTPLCGKLLGEKRAMLETGFYGLNPCLIALAFPFFYQTSWTNGAMWLVLLVIVLSTILLTRFCLALVPFPTMVVPFLITMWILNALAPHWEFLHPVEFGPSTQTPVHFAKAIFTGLGEGIFCVNVWSGILYLIGVVLSHWRHAFLAFCGSAIGASVALFHHAAGSDIDVGLYGFNGVLVAVSVFVFCGGSLRLSLFGAVLSTVLMTAMTPVLGANTLSAPFVLGTWIMMLLGWLELHWFNLPPEPAVPAEGEPTPADHPV